MSIIHASLEEYELRADKLLTRLRMGSAKAARFAARRLAAVPGVVKTAEQILIDRYLVSRGQALNTIAFEAGFRDWSDLRARYNPLPGFDPALLFQEWNDGFLNLWFRTYEEAVAVMNETRFLFPCRNEFFVCEPAFIEAYGVDPNHPDWDLAGRDWVKPKDAAARARLTAMLRRRVIR